MECRICLKSQETNYICIYKELNTAVTILQGIINCSSIKILEGDLLPKGICNECLNKLTLFYEFRQLILKSDETLKSVLYSQNSNKYSYDTQDNTADLKVMCQNGSDNSSKKSNSGRTKKIYECKECNTTYDKADHYKVHMTKHTGVKKFVCEFCPKRFARHYVLVYHRRIHTKEKPYKCDICLKTFRSPSNFYVHKKIHTDEKNHKCNECNESFLQLESLKIHQRRVHTGEKPFLCEICSSSFRSKSSLLSHQLDVHGKKSSCPQCNKFYSARVLKTHIQRHKVQNLGIKHFTCDQCGKNFTCSSSKKKHLLIHSGAKPFSCDVCEKSFNQRSALKTHMRVHSDIMSFLCDYCPKTFKYKHHLKAHVNNHHGNMLNSSSLI